MRKKETEVNEKEIALQDTIAARAELERAKQMFDYANDDYFEIANTELSIAEMKYDVSFKKLKKLCADGGEMPRLSGIRSYATI